MLVIGLGALAFFYLFGMKFFANVALDQYFWWWVIHLWVEGAWELIAAALYALLLIRLFDFPRERAAKYVYLEAGLVLFTGILGTGHHYYWIGTPSYWLTVGGVFSALEPLPLLLMVFDALRIDRARRGVEHPNRLARAWIIGGVTAGIVQIYLERMLGLPFAEVQSYLGIYYDARFLGGALMIAGVALFVMDVFALRSISRRTRAAP